MYDFPKGLFTDVRIENRVFVSYYVKNGDVMGDSRVEEAGAKIRVYDGNMWYTATTNNLADIQNEIDSLAVLATPDEKIYENPVVKNFGSYADDVRKYDGDCDNRKIERDKYVKLVEDYIANCNDTSIEEVKSFSASYYSHHVEKEYYSSKGADIKQDMQMCSLYMNFEIVVDGITTIAYKNLRSQFFEKLAGRYDEVIAARERYYDYAKNAVDVEPGDYVCVLTPIVTAMFTHESFGHKSEADFMLNDKSLRDEWVIGKKVGNEKVSICDRGDMDNNGYTPYDDEGNKAHETWLIKNGVLTGRLHDSKSAAALGEEITGNSRAQSIYHSPIVRMTNTFMEKGDVSPEDMIRDVKDGMYIYDVNYGTGMSTFTMQPNLCYRIRDGKLCEPVRVNVLTGSVFKTLFDIDAVGNDFVLFDTFTCGKGGQSAPVSCGGPTIRVKSLTVN